MTRFTLRSWKLPFTCGRSSARITFTWSLSKRVAEGCTANAKRDAAKPAAITILIMTAEYIERQGIVNGIGIVVVAMRSVTFKNTTASKGSPGMISRQILVRRDPYPLFAFSPDPCWIVAPEMHE